MLLPHFVSTVSATNSCRQRAIFILQKVIWTFRLIELSKDSKEKHILRQQIYRHHCKMGVVLVALVLPPHLCQQKIFWVLSSCNRSSSVASECLKVRLNAAQVEANLLQSCWLQTLALFALLRLKTRLEVVANTKRSCSILFHYRKSRVMRPSTTSNCRSCAGHVSGHRQNLLDQNVFWKTYHKIKKTCWIEEEEGNSA
jgi:hypothetical protein